MMDIEPEVLSHMTMVAKSTYEVVASMYSTEYEIKSKRGAVFKALCNLEERGLIISKVIRTDLSNNASRYWVLPGGTFPMEATA